jgi:hypothetical protein
LSEYFASKKDTNAIKYSNEALLLARSNVSRDVLVALKQLSIIEHKRQVYIIYISY